MFEDYFWECGSGVEMLLKTQHFFFFSFFLSPFLFAHSMSYPVKTKSCLSSDFLFCSVICCAEPRPLFPAHNIVKNSEVKCKFIWNPHSLLSSFPLSRLNCQKEGKAKLRSAVNYAFLACQEHFCHYLETVKDCFILSRNFWVI